MRGPSSHYCHGEWPSHNAAGGTLCPAGTLPSVTNEMQRAGKPATGFATCSQRPGQLPLPEPQLVLWAVKTCQEMSIAAAHGSQHPWPRDASPRQWDSATMARPASHTQQRPQADRLFHQPWEVARRRPGHSSPGGRGSHFQLPRARQASQPTLARGLK